MEVTGIEVSTIDCIGSDKELIEQLQKQLAASQIREAKLRGALEKLVRFNSSNEYTEVLSTYISNGREALFQPADDTAIRELISKAGEVMRKRCIAISQNEMDDQYVDSDPWYSARACRDSIREIPSITLEDLK